MLIRFAVENYLSIFDRQEFSLVATKLKGPTDGLLRSDALSKVELLPASIIYGANASGKTNLAKAIGFLRSKILFSHSRGDPTGGVPRTPFALDPNATSMPTKVDADFVVNGVRYHYGFEANSETFISEWLYSFPEGNRRKLFERNGNEVEFGPTMKGAKKALTEFMRPNSLFLSTATQNDHEELSKIVSFFRNYTYSSNLAVEGNMVNNTFKKGEIDSRTIEILRKIGTGVISYRKKDEEIPDVIKSFTRKIFELTKEQLSDSAQSELKYDEDLDKQVAIELGHGNTDGTTNYFSLQRESSGTRRLLVILNSVFKAIDAGSLIIIDELDASLHTYAAELVLSLFCNPEINKNGAQIIATTHDTNLMTSKLLRRDQIWFTEKDNGGATHAFPLSEIKTRQTDDFEAGYLQGRYGAIPFSGSAAKLFDEL